MVLAALSCPGTPRARCPATYSIFMTPNQLLRAPETVIAWLLVECLDVKMSVVLNAKVLPVVRLHLFARDPF